MKYIQLSTDPWKSVAEEETVSVAPHRLLNPAQWQSVRASWPTSTPVGLVWGPADDVEPLAADLARIAVLMLHFPKWVDGRAYSQARLLRSRYRFEGEIRATGDVVVDMLPLLKRTGFDAVCLRAGQSQEIAERALGFFTGQYAGHYQADVVQHQPLFAR
jgi:uncharacterized protein (DUF934 family)